MQVYFLFLKYIPYKSKIFFLNKLFYNLKITFENF